MDYKRKYHIIIGSKAFFDRSLPSFSKDDEVYTFLELVKLSDAAKQGHNTFNEYADKLIVKNNNYHGIVETAHDRLGSLIEDLTTDDAEIYIHNPPRVLKDCLEDQYSRSLIELDVKSEKYGIKRDSELFVHNIANISSSFSLNARRTSCFSSGDASTNLFRSNPTPFTNAARFTLKVFDLL